MRISTHNLKWRVGLSACHHCFGAVSRLADAKCCLTCGGIFCAPLRWWLVSGSSVCWCCKEEWGFSTWTSTLCLCGKAVPTNVCAFRNGDVREDGWAQLEQVCCSTRIAVTCFSSYSVLLIQGVLSSGWSLNSVKQVGGLLWIVHRLLKWDSRGWLNSYVLRVTFFCVPQRNIEIHCSSFNYSCLLIFLLSGDTVLQIFWSCPVPEMDL